MACEGYPRNSFRSSVLGGPTAPETLLVAGKTTKRVGASDGLDAVAVSRSETRRGNHRDSDRHRLESLRAIVRKGGRNHVVALVNLSGGGAMVEGAFKAVLWDKVTLVLGDFGDVECAVRWVRGGRFGLEFAHETRIDCDPVLLETTLRAAIDNNFPDMHDAAEHGSDDDDESDGAEATAAPLIVGTPPEFDRGEARHPLIWSGLIHLHHDTVVARLRNISAQGALIECTSRLTQGSDLLLDLGNAGQVPASVRWACGDQAGLAFAENFDVSLLAQCKPELAPRRWAKPDYLRDESSETSPWASQWGRLTLKDLSRSLSG